MLREIATLLLGCVIVATAGWAVLWWSQDQLVAFIGWQLAAMTRLAGLGW